MFNSAHFSLVDEYVYDQHIKHQQMVEFKMYEIYQEEIRDLLDASSKSNSKHMSIDELPECGAYVKVEKDICTLLKHMLWEFCYHIFQNLNCS